MHIKMHEEYLGRRRSKASRALRMAFLICMMLVMMVYIYRNEGS